jgi:bilirubin oxidase
MGERYEIVFDFSAYKGKTIELRNLEGVGDIGTDDDYKETGKVMRFIVSANGPTQPDTSVVPSTLRNVHWPTPAGNTVNHHFRFERTNGEWRINGVGFADVQNRLLANVPRGTVEIWELENSSGGWTHPIHIHLIDFKVLSRTGRRTTVMPYEAAGLKDVVYLAKGETVKVQAHYAPVSKHHSSPVRNVRHRS